MYGAFDLIENRAKQEPLKVFDAALNNVKPKLEVKSRRVGGSTYQVPVDVRPERSPALGMRWLVIYSRDRGEKTMVEKLAAEILDASQQPRQRGEEERRYAQDGGSEQGVRPLPLVALAYDRRSDGGAPVLFRNIGTEAAKS